MTTNTNDMFFRGKRTDPWKTVIHSGNIGSQSVNYANSAGNADTLDGTHLNGIFTAFGNNANNITATIGGVTKSFLVNWAADSDKLDGYHASGLLTSITNTNNGISVTVGGTTKSVSNISVNYASSAGNADTTDGVHITWAGELTSTSHLVAWEANGSALRNINPANVTVGNSDKLDGYHATSGNNKPWGTIPVITAGGWMDIGKDLEFHYDNTTGSDYSTALMCTGNHSNIVYLPSKSGTLALTSDIKDTNTWRPITDNYKLGESGTSLSSLGSLTLYNDLLDSIPNPTNYYWANNKITSTSKIDAEVRVKNLGAGCSTTIENTIMATNWIRTTGDTGIYF